jgi:hypothetical protein
MSVALPMLLIGAGAAWQLIAVTAVIPGVLQAIYYVLWTTALQDAFPPTVLVRINGWNMVASYALMPLITLSSGSLASAFGAQRLAIGAGTAAVAATISTVTVLGAMPRIRRSSSEPAVG